MRRLLSFLVLIGSFLNAQAVPSELKLLHIKPNYDNKPSLQRGAKYFMNYCSGCHSIQYMRYSTLGEGIGVLNAKGELDMSLLTHNLMFVKTNILQPIVTSMPPESARIWFGIVPPDLSLEARAKGPDWLYTYLKTFYNDSTRTLGTNNLLRPGVAMPNVLAQLQGDVKLSVPLEQAMTNDVNELLTLEHQGQLTPEEFDSMIYDLVNFLNYVSEPIAPIRKQMGLGVLLYLCIFWGVAYTLKRNYWKDIHKNKQNSTH